MKIEENEVRESKQIPKEYIYNRLISMGKFSGKVLLTNGQVVDQPDFTMACELEMLHGAEILEAGDERIHSGSKPERSESNGKRPAKLSAGEVGESKPEESEDDRDEDSEVGSGSSRYWKTKGKLKDKKAEDSDE